MTQQMIKVPGLPEGWKAADFRWPKKDVDYVFDGIGVKLFLGKEDHAMLIVEKIQPRRIVLESTREKREPVTADDYFFNSYGNLRSGHSLGVFEIWKQVKETDIPLTNEEPKLSLSVDECKKLMRIMEGFNVSDLSVKVHEFLKVKI